MGKTYRRGGNERGYNTYGKSIHEKRQKSNTNRSNWDQNYDTSKPNKGKSRKVKSEYEGEQWYQ